MNDQIKPIEFDVQGALRAGYTPSEIAAHLGQLAGFDVDKARKAGYTDQELVSQLAAPKPQQAPEGQDFTRGFGVAMGQLAPLAKGAVGLAGATAEKAFGAGGAATAVKEWGLKGYQEGMAKLQPMQRETDDLTTAWDRAKQGDLGALVDWAQYGLGYSAGQLVQSGAVAVAGGLLGAAAGGPAGATAGAVTGAVEPTIIKAAAQKLIQGAVAKEMATLAATEAGRSMSKEALQAAATKAVASSIGQGVGLTGMAGVQELGSIYPEAEAQAKAEGRQLDGSDLARVWATGIGAAALEGLIDKLGADALLGKVRLPGNGGRLARAATGAAAAGAVEGGTEFAQTALERVGAGQPLTGQDATSDYVNSVALGVIGGAPVGGVSGALHAQQRAARDAQDQQSIQKLAGAQSIDEVVAAAEELTRASDQLAPAVSAFRGEAPAAGQAGAGGPIATPAATQVATPAPVEAPTGFVGPQQFPVGPLEQRRQNLDRQSELLGQANTAGFAAEREQALAQERVARGGPTDRGAAADFADLAPMPKKQAQARLLVLREQEGGDRPMDLVVAKHPNVPGAYAIRRLPPVVAAAPTPATGPSAQEAQARLEKASLEGTVAARKAEDQPRQDIVSKAMKSIEARGGVASPEEARIVQEAGLGKPYDRVDASLSTPLTEDQRLTQATGIALQKSPKETTVPGKASALAAEKAQMEADAAAAKARGDAAREAKRVADNDASMAKREKQQAFSAAASPIGQAALERQAAQPKAAPAAHAVVDILRHPPFQRTPEQRATLADARQTHGVETMKLFDKAANSPFELSAPEKMRLKSLGYDTNTDARAAETHESPTNKLLATREQVLAGNAPLGHIRIAGMGISVENNAGSMRVDKHNVPPKWKQKLKHHYGYFKGTIGKDKDHVDVFVVPGTPENFDGSVFVVDQKNAKGGFDEHKVVLGATNLEHARQVYLANYAPGWKGLKNITEMPMSRFKAWVYDKEQTKREAAKIAPAAGKKESPQRGVDINSLPPVSRSETRQIGDNTVKVHTLSRPVALALNQFAKLFGHRIELFTDANAGDGFVTSDDPTVIHLNTESSMPHIAVLGHEVMHQLRKANPEAYKAVEAVVRAQLTDGAAEDFAAYYGQGAQDLTEEMVSDLLGNRWMEPEFLSGVFDALRQKHGEAAGGMIDALAKAIRATIDAMLRVLNGQRAFRTDAMVKDLDAVREALKTALANYAEQKRGAPIEQARDEATGQFIASEKRKTGANPISVVGIHYSKQQRPVLTTATAGSNYLGAERERGAVKDRLYFYVDTGSGVRPEEGVGSYAHKATLTNLYDAGSDPEYLAEDSKGLNDFEQRVVAAGYDGYYKPDFRTDEGAAVLLGRHEVKAEFVGRGSLPPSGERPQRAARVNEGWRATAEAFRENDKLPSGNVLAKDWPARVQRVDAELYDQMADSGLWDRLLASNDRLYKDEVLREYKQLVGQQNSTKRHEYVSKHLTPAEQAKMRGAIADRVVKLFDALPSGNEIAAAAWAGRAKRGWYKQSAQAISHVFGPDAPRFAALLAALSPQQSVETNLENAVRVWKGWVKAGRPTDREAILTAAGKHVLGSKGRGSILEAWENNMVRALSHEDPIKVTLSGPKVDSFMRNLLGDVEAVTLDAWMANYSLVEQQLFSGRMPRQDKGGSNDPGKGTGYLAMSARVREAARLLTKYTGEEWTPAEVQETVWSWAKTLYETQAAEGEPRGARELVLDKAITDEMIAATPDFGSLLNDEQYAKHIREVGLDPAAGRAAVAAKPSTAGQKAPFADDAQQRYESQAARRLERLHAEGKDAFATRRELIRESAKRSASEAFSPENVKDLLEHDDWAVLTASDPNATKTSDADNAIANKLLEDDLRSMGVDFLPAVGKYGDVQDSYVITGITREQATMLGQRYGQESVLTRDGLVYSDARPDTPATGVTTFDTPPDDFYTEVPSTGAKFSLDLQFSSKREEDLGEFRKRMLDEVKARAETTKVLVRQHDWRFNVGDQFLSVKTGKTYELTGRTIQKHREFNAETKKLGEPRMTAMYYYEGRDGERGTFVESKMLNSTTLIPLTTPKWSPRRHAFGTLTTGQEAALRNVGGLTTPQTIQQRWAKAKDGLGMRVRQELVDQFAPLAELDPTAYMLARMSKGSDGTLEAAMLYGKPFLDASGVADVNINDGGFAKVLASLEGEHDRFLWWVAAQRAEGLKAIGLENLFSRTDIQELKSLDQGNLANGQPRSRVYADSLTKLNEFNEAVLRLSRDSGLIDDSAYQLLKDLPYVPFYRVMEDEQAMTGPRFSSGLVNQRAWKKLKGGSQKLNDDLLANVLQNWGHLYDAAAKNRAAVRSLRAAEAMGLAFESPVAGKGTVRVLEQGKTKYFVIDDPQVYGAVSSLEYVAPSWFKPLTTFKRWLTLGVTASPAFKIRNLLRDSLSAVAQSPLSGNVLKNVSSGWKDTNTKTSQTYASMLASGGVIRFGTMLEGDRATRAHDLVVRAGGKILDEKGFAKLTRQMHGVLHAYNELGDRSENLNRVALYKQLRADGYDHAEASFMARDLLDFSLSGRAPVMRFLAQTVPFFNARLQGLYKLGRAAKDDPKKFAAVAGGVVAASMALMLAYKDDEDWKQREDWDRDNYWWFKIGDTAYRIPKPFEVGAIGTLAERTWEMAFDKEMDAHRYGQRLSNMLFQTFAFDPTPQVVKPLLDVYANQDSFTGRSIETESLKNLRPEDRVTASTSSVARVLGLLGLPDPAQLAKGRYDPLSPVQIDYLTRAYFGWMGATATAFVDAGMRPLTGRGERPDYTLKDLSLGFAETQPGLQSRYVTAFYEQAKEIDQAWASFRAAQKQGDGDLARTILEDEGGKLAAREMVDRSKKRLAEINARMRMVEASTTMSGDQKRTTLNLLTEQRNALAKGALAGVPR